MQTNPAELLETCKEWIDDTTRAKNYLNSLMLYRKHVVRLANTQDKPKLSFEQIKFQWSNVDKVERNAIKKVVDQVVATFEGRSTFAQLEAFINNKFSPAVVAD
jgi:SOS response regulatory protein OraA/RecX